MKSIVLSSVCALTLLNGSTLSGRLAAQENDIAPSPYVLNDLGIVGPPPGQAFTVANDGLVSGAQAAPQGKEHAFLWFEGFKLSIGRHGLGGGNSVGFGVNNWAQVVGQADTSTIDPLGEDFCGFKSLGFSSSTTCLAYLWQDGHMTPLPTLGGNNGAANAINNRGEIGGEAETSVPDPNCPAPQILQFKPAIWRDGQVHALPTFGHDVDGVVLSVNDHGQAVGASGDCAHYNPISLLGIQPLHALLWEKGKAIDLGNLGGTGHASGILAYHINNHGQVIGASDLPGDTTFHAFLWTRERGIQDLQTIPGDFASVGLGNNDRGEAVGASLDSNFNSRAFLWRNGVMADLNTLVPVDSALSLWTGASINSRGDIVGLAQDKKTKEFHAYLASPRCRDHHYDDAQSADEASQ